MIVLGIFIGFQVKEHGTYCLNGQRQLFNPKTPQALYSKMILDFLLCRFLNKGPRIYGRHKSRIVHLPSPLFLTTAFHQNFFRCILHYQTFYVGKIALGYLYRTGGNICKRHSGLHLSATVHAMDTSQKIVFSCFQKLRIVRKTGSDYLYNAALDQFLGQLGIFQLFTNGHFITGFHQFGQIRIYGVVRESGQFHICSRSVGSSGQNNPQSL